MRPDPPLPATTPSGLHPDVAVVSGVLPFVTRLTVLHVTRSVSTGVGAYVSQVAGQQARNGWDVHVAAPEPLADPQVHFHMWPARREPWRGTVTAMRSLRATVDRVRPDVVVLHSARAGHIGRLLLRGSLPTVFVPHAWSWLGLPPVAAFAALAWERLAAHWTHTVIAVSDGEARAGTLARIHAPFSVVLHPVPIGWSEVPHATAPAARAELSLPPGPVAVSVGRLSRKKGQDVLLRAWPAVTCEHPGATLVLVGDGPAEAELRAQAPPGVVFVGAVDPRPYVAAADVVVVASRWEACSLAMLEAMASGRSVVTTQVFGSEVLTRAGAGAVVPVGAVAPLAEAVAARLGGTSLAHEEGRHGAAYVQRHHDSDVAMDRFAAVVSRAPAFGGA